MIDDVILIADKYWKNSETMTNELKTACVAFGKVLEHNCLISSEKKLRITSLDYFYYLHKPN